MLEWIINIVDKSAIYNFHPPSSQRAGCRERRNIGAMLHSLLPFTSSCSPLKNTIRSLYSRAPLLSKGARPVGLSLWPLRIQISIDRTKSKNAWKEAMHFRPIRTAPFKRLIEKLWRQWEESPRFAYVLPFIQTYPRRGVQTLCRNFTFSSLLFTMVIITIININTTYV